MATKQRYKLYKAEDAALNPCGWLSSVEAAQGQADWMCRTKFWSDHGGPKFVRVKYPIYGCMSGAVLVDTDHGELLFGPFSMCQSTFYHEATHLLTWVPGKHPERDHGPQFAGMLILVIRRYMGAEWAKELQREFEARKIKYTLPE